MQSYVQSLSLQRLKVQRNFQITQQETSVKDVGPGGRILVDIALKAKVPHF